MKSQLMFGDEMKIEQWMLDEVLKHKPCSESFTKYKAGQSIQEVSFDDAHWVEEHCPDLVKKLNLKYPLYVFNDGDGFGFGKLNKQFDKGEIK